MENDHLLIEHAQHHCYYDTDRIFLEYSSCSTSDFDLKERYHEVVEIVIILVKLKKNIASHATDFAYVIHGFVQSISQHLSSAVKVQLEAHWPETNWTPVFIRHVQINFRQRKLLYID